MVESLRDSMKLQFFTGTSVNLQPIHYSLLPITSKKWWAKMDSLCCGKATAVATVHWTVAKSRLSSPFWLSRPLRCSVLWGSVSFFRFCRSWWAKMDSNHRPHDYQSCALASWAIGPFWWRLAGSNRWPPACKAGALPAELNPQIFSHLLTRYIHWQLSTVNCQFYLYPLNWITLIRSNTLYWP